MIENGGEPIGVLRVSRERYGEYKCSCRPLSEYASDEHIKRALQAIFEQFQHEILAKLARRG